jgi:hypothetical protein
MSKILTILSGVAVVMLLMVLGGTLIGVAGSEPQVEVGSSSSVGTAFTYQGYLTESQNPANGPFDLAFSLYDDPEADNQVGPTVSRTVTMTEGLFTVELDFGDVFDDTALWLEIRVRPAGDTGPYTPLLPRQRLTPVPLATFSTRAASTSWAGLTDLPAGFGDGVDDDTLSSLACAAGEIAEWNGSAWSCGTDEVGAGGSAWLLTGNAGTASGIDFLGTTDDQALELRVDGSRALRLEPNVTSPNVLGGYDGNSAGAGVDGATIGGGGRDQAVNQANGNFSTVVGGAGNTAGGYASAVGGGEGNAAGGSYAAAGGGSTNSAGGAYTALGGGQANTATATHATIAGGGFNQANAPFATVGGGAGNVVSDTYATVSGGTENEATGAYASVGGGSYNSVAGAYGNIAGGGPSDPENPTTTRNSVFDDYGTVGGGGGNVAGGDDGDPTEQTYATVGGGAGNAAGDDYATVGGGSTNTAGGYAATVGGGAGNRASNQYATVGGGTGNAASNGYATVAGGRINTAGHQYATVSGGYTNTVSAVMGAIGGGYSNMIAGNYGTIPGGFQNYVSGSYGFAAGQQARAEHAGTFVWSDSTGAFASTGSDQFLIDASGGVGIGTNSPSEMLTVDGSALLLSGDSPVARGSYTSSWRLLDAPSAVYAAGNEVYVTSYSTNTLAIFDVSNPDSIVYVGHSTSNLSGPSDLFVSGERAYVTSELNNRLVVFDLSNPSAPDSLGSTDESLTHPLALYVAGKYAYVASNGSPEAGAKDGLAVFDVSDPEHIRLTGFTSTYLEGTTDVFVAGSYAYVTSGSNSCLAIFDISVPRTGQIEAMGFATGSFVGPRAVFVSGQYAYVVAETSNDLVVFDVSDPNNIVTVGSIGTNLNAPHDIFVAGDLAYVASSGNDRLAVFDISDPANIVAKGFADTGDGSKPVSLSATGKHVYVVAETANMLSVYDVSHLETPTLRTGTLQTAYLDVVDNAAISNDLAVDGGLQVGPGGALIGGALSVTGQDDSHILGALSVGGAGALISDTAVLTRSLWVTAPTHALDVIGEARFRVNDYHNLALRSPNAGSDEDAYIDFFRSNQTTVITPSARIEFDASDPFTHSTSLRFYTQGREDAQPWSRLEITANGDVRPGADDAYSLGTAGRRWQTVYSVDGVEAMSDGRYKENVSALPYGLDEVIALRPVSFTWIQRPDEGLHYGLIAQEVREVLPDIVSGDGGENGTLGMNYSELVPVLVKAVQEQQKEIDTQAQQIEDLEARLAALEGAQPGQLQQPGVLNLLAPFGFGGLALGAVVLVRKRRTGGRS